MYFCGIVLLYSQFWQGLLTNTSCLQGEFLSFLLVFGLGCALSKYGLLSWTKEFRYHPELKSLGRQACVPTMWAQLNSISIVWKSSVTCLCFELSCYWYQLWMPIGLSALLSQSRWVLHWSGELCVLGLFVLIMNTAHWVVSSVLNIVCPGCQYIHGLQL